MPRPQKDELYAIRVNGFIYRPGARCPKPMNAESALGSGADGVVESIRLMQNVVELCFIDGERFLIANMPAIFMYNHTPEPKPLTETTDGVVPSEA